MFGISKSFIFIESYKTKSLYSVFPSFIVQPIIDLESIMKISIFSLYQSDYKNHYLPLLLHFKNINRVNILLPSYDMIIKTYIKTKIVDFKFAKL